MDKTYLTCAETAKLVRTALKKRFPGVKFGVRSSTYSMGASIRVSWMDGPATKEVEAETAPYASAGFDGMIDLKYHTTSWLMPDGSAAFAHSHGTEGGHGSVPSYDYSAPHPDAKRVSFGADYIFCERSHGEARMRKAIEHVKANYGLQGKRLELKPYASGGLYVDADNYLDQQLVNEYLEGRLVAAE